jgi:TolB-like protein
MAEERVQRRLAAILAADVVGYSRLMEADEEGTRARLKSLYSELVDPRIAANGGRIVKTMGDGILVEFSSAVDAVRNALDVQAAVRRRNADVPEEIRIEFRAGINLGDILVEGDDIHGDGVNVAARLEGLCEPGEVYVSGTVRDHVEGKLDARFDDLGEHTVKNIARPVQVYRVRSDTAPSPAMDNPETALPLPDKPSIAVLPFANMSGDKEQEYFADGIAEDVITGLSRFSWFFVIARNSSFSYKGTSPDVRQVANELGVQYVLEGSVRKSANRVRITAQLIDALTGRHVWAERYDRELDDIFAVQDEITEAIVGAVAPSFISAEARRVERKVPESFDAWDYTMRGNWHLWRFGKDDIAEATRLFDAAIALDPRSSPALSGLSIGYLFAFLFGWADDLGRTREQAHQAAMKGVAADENDAWAQAALCFVSGHLREFDAAIGAGHRALDLNPNLAFAEGALGHTYAILGDYHTAVPHVERAERLSPRDPARVLLHLSRSWVAILVGRYEESVLSARKMVESNPDFPTGWRHLAADYGQLGRHEEARQAVARLRRLVPNASIASTRARVPFAPQSEDAMERFLDGLRKAGLPEE